MRKLIGLLVAYLFPPCGQRRAEAVPTQPKPPREPWQTVRTCVEPLRGEDVALVRPYVVAWERQRERALQRDRRTAAALASMGVDFMGVSA